MSELTDLERKLRSLLQTKVISSSSLPTKKEGEESDMKTIFYKTKYYLAVKINNNWRFFQETKLTEV